ncbi:MAG TPA: hypothetical protein EYN67_08770 [Flavobacteriales bacterium]|nr:hypothetical protein [Flavobacteriales bacterium]
MEIYSKDGTTLLHIINRVEDIRGRTDIIPEDNFLQLAALQVEEGTQYKPHKHRWKKNSTTDNIAQESWVVISGKVEFYFYDIDDTLIGTEILNPGDCSITLFGGHTYKILEDAIIYEYKTGPYLGLDLDKEFLDEEHT